MPCYPLFTKKPIRSGSFTIPMSNVPSLVLNELKNGSCFRHFERKTCIFNNLSTWHLIHLRPYP